MEEDEVNEFLSPTSEASSPLLTTRSPRSYRTLHHLNRFNRWILCHASFSEIPSSRDLREPNQIKVKLNGDFTAINHQFSCRDNPVISPRLTFADSVGYFKRVWLRPYLKSNTVFETDKLTLLNRNILGNLIRVKNRQFQDKTIDCCINETLPAFDILPRILGGNDEHQQKLEVFNYYTKANEICDIVLDEEKSAVFLEAHGDYLT